jgi:glycosyltransferase involved in cell wall biosynthesis
MRRFLFGLFIVFKNGIKKYMSVKLIRITTVPGSLKTLLKGQSEHGFEVVGVSTDGAILEEVAGVEGIRVTAVKMTRLISPFIDLKSLWYFYRVCRREKPIIVHSHTPKAGIVGMLGSRLAGVPIRLHTVAGLPLMEAKGVKRFLLDVVEKLTYRCATNVYPNSRGLSDFIIRNNLTCKEKLRVLGKGSSNGIDTSFFDPRHFGPSDLENIRKSLGLSPIDFVFIYVGRIVGDKGINELITAFSLLLSDGVKKENVKLLLVGPFESDLDPLMESTLKCIEGNPSILSVGFQDDVRQYFAISDCLVFPSYREGFPNVVMQAGAMGLPSIVTNINGCNEIIREGENGLIIPVKDVNALFLAMKRILHDRVYHSELRENARRMIQLNYEQFLIWKTLLDEYKRLLMKKRLDVNTEGLVN